MKMLLLPALVAFLAPAVASDATPAAYPFTTCIVSGETLGGEMGEPVVFAQDGREVKLCCPTCRKKFVARADDYLTIIDAGVRAKEAGSIPVNPAAAPQLADPGTAQPDAAAGAGPAPARADARDPAQVAPIEGK